MCDPHKHYGINARPSNVGNCADPFSMWVTKQLVRSDGFADGCVLGQSIVSVVNKERNDSRPFSGAVRSERS